MFLVAHPGLLSGLRRAPRSPRSCGQRCWSSDRITRGEATYEDGQPLVCVELCFVAGGQALGLERAGFQPLLLAEVDGDAVATLEANRPDWLVVRADIRTLVETGLPEAAAADLLAAGVPCPPFSVAGLGAGPQDERDLFPAVLAAVAALRPRAVLVENVRGLLQQRFETYRASIRKRLSEIGYSSEWRLLYSSEYGVPQLRPRAVLIALPIGQLWQLAWPVPRPTAAAPVTAGEALRASMEADGWELAEAWARGADRPAPALCGGSRRHGGPDLGPEPGPRGLGPHGLQRRQRRRPPPSAGRPPSGPAHSGATGPAAGLPCRMGLRWQQDFPVPPDRQCLPAPAAEAFGRALAEVLRAAPPNGRAPMPAARTVLRPSPQQTPGAGSRPLSG